MTIPFDIFAPQFWEDRLAAASKPGGRLRHSVYYAHNDIWDDVCNLWKERLREEIRPDDSVLDCGCGYGQVLFCMPEAWKGEYLGIDLCPGFVAKARQLFPGREFRVGNLRDLSSVERRFDVAVLGSVKGLIIRSKGVEVWEPIEREIMEHVDRMVALEYRE